MSSTEEYVRKAMAALIIASGVVFIGVVFWHQEIRYSLPTPVPQHYTQVEPGEKILLPSRLPQETAYFLHFYNPECPCSRFNARHIQSLIGNYRDSIRFIIVVSEISSLAKAQREFGEDLDYINDHDHAIAKACGVYSTPQAAIVSSDSKLYYRGNYNSTRYCTTRASNFAELSLVALINNQPAPAFGLAATQSYGCELNPNQVEFF